MATLVQFRCKRKAWSSCFHMFIVMILIFFYAGHGVVICDVLAPWYHDVGR